MLIDSAREKYFTGKYVKRWWRKKQKSLVTRNRPTWPDSPSFLTSEKAIHLMYHCWDKEMVSSQTWAGSALLPVSLGSHPASGWVPCQYWQGGGLALLVQQDLTYKDGLAWVSPKSAGMLPRWQLCFYLGHSCRYAGMRTRLGAWVWDGKGVAGKGMGFSCSWPDVRVAKLSSEVQTSSRSTITAAWGAGHALEHTAVSAAPKQATFGTLYWGGHLPPESPIWNL